jgi:hypothetical protein
MVSSSFNQTQKHLEEYPTIDSKSYDRYDLEIKDVFSDRIETQEELELILVTAFQLPRSKPSSYLNS